MGWYRRNQGGRYRDDLMKIIGDDFTRHGLPRDSGITLRVSEDSQRGMRDDAQSPVGASPLARPPRQRTSGSMTAPNRHSDSPARTGFGATGPLWSR
jgi:hypothetical protein